MTTIGRPREYATAAEKQRAYRERKKYEQYRIGLALEIMEEVENRAAEIIVTLQKDGYIEISKHSTFAMIYFSKGSSVIDWYTVQHMIRMSQLVKVSQDFLRIKYKLSVDQL